MPISGTCSIAAVSKSLRPARQSPSGPLSTPFQRREHVCGRKLDAGVEQKHGLAAYAGIDKLKLVPGPFAASREAEQARRHVSPERRRDLRRMCRVDAPKLRQQAECGRRVSGAATDPRRDGEILRQRKCRALVDTGGLLQRLSRPHHQIVLDSIQVGGKLTGHLEQEFVSRDSGQHVAVGAKGKDGLKAMAPVRQPAPHMQRQVELGGRRFLQLHQGAALAEVSPVSIFAFNRAATSSSAVTSAADHA